MSILRVSRPGQPPAHIDLGPARAYHSGLKGSSGGFIPIGGTYVQPAPPAPYVYRPRTEDAKARRREQLAIAARKYRNVARK